MRFDNLMRVWVRQLDYDQADLSLLSGEEQQLAQRVVSREERGRYVARRALLRRVLGAVVSESPTELTIELRCERCQRLHPSPLSRAGRSVWWSMSSTGSTVAIAAATSPVGIDLEPVDGHTGWQAVAHRFFPRAESHAIAGDERQFAISWTLKEAFLKSLGVGLVGRLDTLDSTLLVLTSNGWLRSQAYPNWSFRSLSSRTGIAMGIAVRGTPARFTLDTKDKGQWTA